jgi:putative ABC transport system permease protein
LPEQPGEIVVSADIAGDAQAGIGSMLTVSVTGTAIATDATVVGIWSGAERFGDRDFGAIAFPSDHVAWLDGIETWRLYLVAEPNADIAAITAAIGEGRTAAYQVTTSAEMVDRAVAERGTELEIQQTGVRVFGILALLVAGVVVSNTMAILVAQRTREIALLRCAGGSRGQMRAMVLVEAAIAGVVASILGILLATAIANAALPLLERLDDSARFAERVWPGPGTWVMALVAGILISLLAAWIPARTATGVNPLQALRAATLSEGEQHGIGFIQAGVAVLFLAGGGFALAAGLLFSFQGQREVGLLAGLVGGLTSFTGIVLGAAIVVPAVAHLMGAVTGRFGVPARIAASNGVRNPRRTTATTIALVIGVALVTMMSVGATSLKATLDRQIDAEAPWDVAVTTMSSTDFDSLAEIAPTVAGLEGVAGSVAVSEVMGTFELAAGVDPRSELVEVVEPADLIAVWRYSNDIERFRPGTVIVPLFEAEASGIVEGDTVTIDIDGTELELTAIVANGFTELVVARADLPNAPASPVLLWLRVEDGADPEEVAARIYRVADEAGVVLDVDSLTSYRESLDDALNALLAAVTGMLLVAVTIALIGVGNTLTLSVLERTRESALLLALGLTRRQLRAALAVEGCYLAAIGTVIGIVLGTIYGWIGALTLIGDSYPVALGFPSARIAVIAVIAVACGLLASILPARRAATADPVVALAEG